MISLSEVAFFGNVFKIAFLSIAHSFSFLCYLHPQVKSVYAKGSWANRGFRPGFSDIDLAVFLDPDRQSYSSVRYLAKLKSLYNLIIPVIGEIEVVNRQLVNTSSCQRYTAKYFWRKILGGEIPTLSPIHPSEGFDLDEKLFYYCYYLCQNYLYGRDIRIFKGMVAKWLKHFDLNSSAEVALLSSEPKPLLQKCLILIDGEIDKGLTSLELSSSLSGLSFSALFPYMPPTLKRFNNFIPASSIPDYGFYPPYRCRYSEQVVTTHPMFISCKMAHYMNLHWVKLDQAKKDFLLLTILFQWRGVFLNSFKYQERNNDTFLTLIGWVEFIAETTSLITKDEIKTLAHLDKEDRLQIQLFSLFQKCENEYLASL